MAEPSETVCEAALSREFAHTDESALPVWLGEKEKINEPLFCEELLKDYRKTDGTLILE